MSESLLQLGGSPATKPFKNIPLTTSLFFSGLWTQRSPFGSPDSRYYTKFIGGRTDILIDGLNVELTNYGTLIRRPGFIPYSTDNVGSGPLSFYSFHPITSPINVMVDTATNVYTLTGTVATSIFTKTSGAGQTYFQGVGNTLYMGSSLDQKAYPVGLTTRNWGIGTAQSGGSVTKLTGTGADVAVSGQTAWTNPGNVTSAVSFATVSASGGDGHFISGGSSHYLEATNFGFSEGSNIVVVGIQVTFDGSQAGSGASLGVLLLKNGTGVGVAKALGDFSSTNGVVLGGATDLWGTTWSFNDFNQSNFGVAFVSSSSGFTWNYSATIRNVNITLFVTGTTITAVSGSAGGFSAVTGYQYVYAYTNQQSGHVGNPSPISVTTGPFTNKLNVSITVTASTDPQVTGIRVFRTKDGGSTLFELPTSPFPNTSGNVTDNNTDITLQLLAFFNPNQPFLANSQPPVGLGILAYHLNRMWGAVGNNVYFSALLGDDITIGVGVEAWPPVNVFIFPSVVNRLVPITSGLLVFTTDDVYMIAGNSRTGSTGPILQSVKFYQGVGILSYNAMDVQGNQIFMYTSDRQFLSFNASGPVEIGYPIGVDIQNNFSPNLVYVASIVTGTQDKAVFVDDGTASWYRCNWNQPPEGGPSWSPKATIVGGSTAIASIETSPGTYRLLVGQSNGTVLQRSYTTFADNGTAYSAFATIGSLVLAKPGQLAALNSIILELQNTGSVPSLALMLDEISGNNFETLVNFVDDPPKLAPSTSIMSKRWYLSQGNDPAWCRHIQLKISFSAEAYKNELITVTAIGALVSEE